MADSTVDLTQMLATAQEMGFFQVVVPFLLVFAIIYGVLETIQLFKKEINVVIAFVFGVLVTGSGVFTKTLASYTPYLAMMLFFLLSFLVVLGLATGKKVNVLESLGESGPAKGIITVIIFGIMLFFFYQQALTGTGAGGTAAGGLIKFFWENIGVLGLIAILGLGIIIVVTGGKGGEE